MRVLLNPDRKEQSMRTDAVIDRVQVICRGASTLGYGKWKAQVGDLILFRQFKEDTTLTLGRMIGRVHYAPALEGDSKAVHDHILCLCINSMLDYTFERWVDPANVVIVHPMDTHSPHRRDVVMSFLSDDLIKAGVEEVREMMSARWSTLEGYRGRAR